jgi:hypothetical protein
MKSLNVILCAIFCGRVEHEKATKLRSPNFHVSTTRLALHNLPKDLMEKDLKELVIKAVKSRASKQHPVVKQVYTIDSQHLVHFLCLSITHKTPLHIDELWHSVAGNVY